MLYPGILEPPSLFDPSPRAVRSCQTKLYMPVSEPVTGVMVTGVELTDGIERGIMLRRCRPIVVGRTDKGVHT